MRGAARRLTGTGPAPHSVVVECIFARVKREFPILGRGKFSWGRGHTDRGPRHGRLAKLVYVAGGLYNETCRRSDKEWPYQSREDACA